MLAQHERQRQHGCKVPPGGRSDGSCKPYNEVILSSEALRAALPGVVEAIFITRNSSATLGFAKRVQTDFARHFNLARSATPPLVRLDLARPEPVARLHEHTARVE